MKPGAPSLQSTRLLDQVRERVRYMHYSLKTKKVYLYWIRFLHMLERCSGWQHASPTRDGCGRCGGVLSMLPHEHTLTFIETKPPNAS